MSSRSLSGPDGATERVRSKEKIVAKKSIITITVLVGGKRTGGKKVVVGGKTGFTNNQGVAEFDQFDADGSPLEVYCGDKGHGRVNRGGSMTVRI